MKVRIGWLSVGLAALGGSVLLSGSIGCQSDNGNTTTGSNAQGSGGGTSSGTNSGGAGGSGSTTSTMSTTSTTSTMSSASSMTTTGNGMGGAGTGGGNACDGQAATIEQLTTGEIGPDIDVKLAGVVAMSQKFLVSKGSQTGSCLWGAFVSSPGLTETQANSGILILSYGDDAVVPEGGGTAQCPKLEDGPVGDRIPDDLVPGDVLDVVGVSSYFLLSQCAGERNGSSVAQRQVGRVCSAVKTGTAAVPAAHALAEADFAKLSSPTDTAFHDAWGGVKVRLENVTPKLVDGNVVGGFGIITLNEGNVNVADKIYYRNGATEVCHMGPVFGPETTFDAIEGFSYLNFCTWDIEPNDKCADFEPQSEDCRAASCAP